MIAQVFNAPQQDGKVEKNVVVVAQVDDAPLLVDVEDHAFAQVLDTVLRRRGWREELVHFGLREAHELFHDGDKAVKEAFLQAH